MDYLALRLCLLLYPSCPTGSGWYLTHQEQKIWAFEYRLCGRDGLVFRNCQFDEDKYRLWMPR